LEVHSVSIRRPGRTWRLTFVRKYVRPTVKHWDIAHAVSNILSMRSTLKAKVMGRNRVTASARKRRSRRRLEWSPGLYFIASRIAGENRENIFSTLGRPMKSLAVFEAKYVPDGLMMIFRGSRNIGRLTAIIKTGRSASGIS
jgi:hypothetical protein